MFDGVHRGHRAVIGAAVASARAEAGVGAVLTFSPHPSVLFRSAQPTRLLQTEEEKAAQIAGCGVQVLITQPFTPEFAARSDEEFARWLKQAIPGLRMVYVGENFRFGRGRTGTPATLAVHAARLGYAVNCVGRVEEGGAPISSTRIRERVEAGDMSSVAELLGRRYSATARVEPGKRIGRTLGFPTLNLAWDPPLRPRLGVYFVRLRAAAGGDWQSAIANYGLRPTVESAVAPRLEVHVLGTCSWGEGDTVEVEWLEFVRPERKFSGLPDLTAQIAADVASARRWFAGREIL
jgi:riboflavin kinase/FMN adenylyltransferase